MSKEEDQEKPVKSYFKNLTLLNKYGSTGSVETADGAFYIGNWVPTISTGLTLLTKVMLGRMESGLVSATWRFPMDPLMTAVFKRFINKTKTGWYNADRDCRTGLV